MEDKNKHRFLKKVLIYTAFFTLIIVFMIYIFLKYKKSFIWDVDGLNQHMVTLTYFRELLINFIKTGEFSTFTWNIGNGINMYGNLAYYIFGDIFSYFSILVPSKYLEYFYSVMVVVRMFFMGVSFLYFCDYKNMNRNSSVIGALMYTFCTFALFSAVRHPYFCNALILFPLVMVGIEKIVNEDKKMFYTVIIALLYIGNFYFAYMISLVIAIYGLILIIQKYKKDGIKKIISKILQVLFYSIIGIMISAIILLPTGIEFLNSERSAEAGIQPYTISYYRKLVNNILDYSEGSYWVYTGVQSIIMISLPIFIRNRKRDYSVFLTLLVLVIPLLVSNIGSIFCGFSYPNNRWTFIIAFIFSYITTIFINDSCKIDKKDITTIFIFVLIFICLNIVFQNSINTQILTQILFFVLFIVIILNKSKLETRQIKKLNLFQIFFATTFILGILTSIYFKYDIGQDKYSYVSEFIGIGSFNKKGSTSNGKINDFDKAVKFISDRDKSFYTIGKYPINYQNLSLMKKYRAKTLYYSIAPKLYSIINTDLKSSQYSMNFGFEEFDYRTKINTLLGTKYYIKDKKNNSVPYGYSKMEEYTGKSDIYVNNYALPFGVLYTSYINEDEYNNMNALEKESSLLKTVVLKSDNQTSIEHNENAINIIKNNIKEIDYELIDENNIIKDNKVIIKDLNKNQIKLKIGSVQNSEIYLNIENINFAPQTKQEKIESELSKKTSRAEVKAAQEKYKWYQPNYKYKITASYNKNISSKRAKNYKASAYYVKDNEMLVNLGYYDETSGEIKLKFEDVGTYDLSKIKIYAVSMQDYEQDINNLRKSNFEVVEYKNGYLKGTAKAETDGILQLSTIYNKGWKVYVDGEETNTFIANKYFLGIKINQGEHTIELKYSTPYQKEGVIISIIGIVILVGLSMIERLKKKSEEKYEK